MSLKSIRVAALTGAAAIALAGPAFADEAEILKRLEVMQAKIEAQDDAIAAQKEEIERLRAQVAKGKTTRSKTTVVQAAPPAPSADLAVTVETQQAQIDALQAEQTRARLKKQDEPVVGFSNLRPTIASPDGRYSVALRARFQADAAMHFQDEAGPLATDFRRGSINTARENTSARELSNGVSFRRAQIGVNGKFDNDWNASFVYEFGGSGTEGPARINEAWVNYTGFAPFTLQAGAFTPPANMDDSTSSDDQLFIERATPAELSRAIAGADGRIAAGLRANGDNWMTALHWSGGTIGDAEVADEQGAVLGRAAFRPIGGDDLNIHLGLNGTFVYEPADQGSTATGARYQIRYRDRPELRVDSTRLVDTGVIDADSAFSGGAEAAMNWGPLTLQSEYFVYGINRRAPSLLPDPDFKGFYAQAGFVMTGEPRRYNMATASFANPRPRENVTGNGGLGAWEAAVRYSNLDLNFNEGAPGTPGSLAGIRGGEEEIWTFGLNWFLNSNLRLTLDYFLVDVDRLNPAGPGNTTPFGAGTATPPTGVQIGQEYEALALRAQVSF